MSDPNALHRILRIGVTACFSHADPKRPLFKNKTLLYLESSTPRLLMHFDAMPWMIPPACDGWSPSRLIENVDALLLHGGADVAPQSYGQEPLDPRWNGDRIRDDYEMQLVHACLAVNKPILGFCRGAQILNVALGGTLYQDIPTQCPKALTHRNWNIYDDCQHAIELIDGSYLSQLYASEPKGLVNSVHHQAIKQLGKGLVVEAKCPDDGVVEAIGLVSKEQSDAFNPYAIGVQWHPEWMWEHQNVASMLCVKTLMQDFLAVTRQRLALATP